MASKNTNTRRKPKQETFNIATVLDGVKQAEWVALSGDNGELHDGDKLLVDRQRKPRKGDWVVWSDDDGHHVCEYTSAAETGEIYAVVVSLIRDFRKPRPKQKARSVQIPALKQKLERLERAPENEGERFRLETEIFRLENPAKDEWPEVIG